MNRILVILLFICLALSGYQDIADIERQGLQTTLTEVTPSFSPTEVKTGSKFIRENKELISFYTGNIVYVQSLCRISQESETVQSFSEQARTLQKFITGSFLKYYNCKQKISEHVSSIQTITQSALHYSSAHLIFLLRKIVI